MKIRLGYACICNTLNKNFKTINYTNFNNDYDKLNKIIKHNLDTLYEILVYNEKNNIHFYRISSNLIPLLDHPDIDNSKFKTFDEEFKKIRKIIKKNNMRVDMHASEYIVLNSVKKEVVEKSINSLILTYDILKKITSNPKIVIHIGSNAFGKKLALIRFRNNFYKLPKKVRESLIIENDDKTFNIENVINLSNEINIPIVLDYHHHICNHENISIDINRIYNSWNSIPKMHVSSSKSNKKAEFRSHSDYIDINDFIELLDKIKFINEDTDIMIEAKEKDVALFKLVRELKYKGYNFIDETTLLI